MSLDTGKAYHVTDFAASVFVVFLASPTEGALPYSPVHRLCIRRWKTIRIHPLSGNLSRSMELVLALLITA